MTVSTNQTFKNQYYSEEYNYVMNHLFDSIVPVTEFEKVEGRPCEVSEVFLHDKSYLCYDYSHGQLLFIPKDMTSVEGDFDDVISVNANNMGFSVSKVSKEGDVVSNSFYSFNMENHDTDYVTLFKKSSSYHVDSKKFQKAFQKRDSAELFFVAQDYLRFFVDSGIESKGVKVLRDAEKTMYYEEDYSDFFASLYRYLQGEPYEEIEDTCGKSMIEIADSFDLGKTK